MAGVGGVKGSYQSVCRLEAANARQPYGRYKADAADPQDDRKNVQRAGNRNIIHLPALDLPRSKLSVQRVAKASSRRCGQPNLESSRSPNESIGPRHDLRHSSLATSLAPIPRYRPAPAPPLSS